MDDRLRMYCTKMDNLSLRISRKMSQAIKPVLGEGLTSAQFFVLRIVGRAEAVHVSEVAEHLGVTLSAVTSLCDRLETSGWLVRQRDGADRRVVSLRLTESGKAKLAELDGQLEEMFGRYLAKLPPEDLDRLVATLERLAGIMEEPS